MMADLSQNLLDLDLWYIYVHIVDRKSKHLARLQCIKALDPYCPSKYGGHSSMSISYYSSKFVDNRRNNLIAWELFFNPSRAYFTNMD